MLDRVQLIKLFKLQCKPKFNVSYTCLQVAIFRIRGEKKKNNKKINNNNTHTHTHTHIYIYIYIQISIVFLEGADDGSSKYRT